MIFFYTTFSDPDEARNVAKELVRNQAAACVNIVPKIESFYMWEGELQQEDELFLMGKTDKTKLKEVESLIISLHSYETPCFVSFDIAYANGKFARWVENSLNL